MADDDLAKQLSDDFATAVQAGEYDTELNQFMDTVVEVWKSNSPEDSGDYKDSVDIVDPAESGKGRVGAAVGYANLVEYGSANNPEFAPRRRTIEHFNNGAS